MTEQFKALSFDRLCQKLCENKRTLIIYHIRSDADAVGSAFALKEILRVMGIPAYCACSDEMPERLQFLADGTQGSVLLEEDLPIDYERVISVDSASPSQLGSLFTRLRRDVDIMIDHHASGSVYADNYVDPEAAATGEIIYAVAKRLCEMGEIEEIPTRVINCVYAAVSSDTGGFRYANATPRTMRIGAELIEAGVDSAEINRLLFDSKSLKQVQAEGEAIKRLRLHMDGRVASTLLPYAVKAAMGLEDEHLGTLIEIPRSVFGVDVAFAIRQESEEGIFRVSMRSATELDVAKICAVFGGGGHKRAAGCTVEAESILDAEARILEEIYKRM